VRRLLRVLTENWKLKLSAFALAMLLWITVSADQPTTRWLQIPVDVQVRDPDHELVGGPEPRDVRVRFFGTWRDLWEIMVERPPLRLVLTDVSEGVQELILDPTQVQVPRGRGVTAVDIRPATVRVNLLQVARVDVPVRLVVREPLGPELALAESIQVRPPRIRVSGPAERVAGVAEVTTLPFEMPRQPTTFERNVAIDTAGLGGLILSAEEVLVAGRIERTVEQRVPDVPVASPPGVLVVPGAVDVQLRGAESLVAQAVAALRVSVPAEAIPARLPLAGIDVQVRVENVPGMLTVTPQPRTVRVLAAPEIPAPEVRPAPGPPQDPGDDDGQTRE
jgi:YbbR domain-containing protein